MTNTEERQIAKFLEHPFENTRSGAECLRLADAVRALLAERDALKAKVPTPVRKLREVTIRGWRYRVKDGVLEGVGHNGEWSRVGSIVPTDAAVIADLYANPEEPVESVEDVLREMVKDKAYYYTGDCEDKRVTECATRLRAAVAAEGVRDE